ncbi:MAG: pseudouridine synthase, partial [Bacteroidota bacterium]
MHSFKGKNNNKRRESGERIESGKKKVFPREKKYQKNTRVYKNPAEEESIRLNKYISNSGICSRREADTYIQTGLVTVNGKIITELGTKVKPGDDVRINNTRLKPEKNVYILLNKPKDFITTSKDPHAKRTVLDLVQNACRERVFPVGRLDRNTTGVLLITNDGELTKKLTHPGFNKKKIYHVTLDKNLKKSDMERIASGIELEDGFIAADAVSFVDQQDKTQVGIEIHSGRNRVIRRIFEFLGYKVKKLDRV